MCSSHSGFAKDWFRFWEGMAASMDAPLEIGRRGLKIGLRVRANAFG